MVCKCLIIIITILGLPCLLIAIEECKNYKEINDYKRSLGYVSSDATSICDNLLHEGWYRITSPAGEKMPDECPPPGACGTEGSIWLDPGYPESNKTLQKDTYLPNFLDCKSKTYKINITNCWDEYYVYYLTRTDSCPEAYCFGIETKCPEGQYSETGWTPGCGIYPTDILKPTVNPVIKNKGVPEGRYSLSFPELVFECKFTQTTGTAYYYDVIWYINNEEIQSFKNTKSTNVHFDTHLRESHWVGTHKMNMLVKCAVRIRQSKGTVPSPPHESDVFEAGMKVVGTEFQVKEKDTIKIPVRLTVPLGCFENTHLTPKSFKKPNEEYKKTKCILSMQTAIPNYQRNPDHYCVPEIDGDGIVFTNQRCGLSFFAANWTETTEFEVTGELDLKYNANDRAVFIRIATQTVSFHPIWENIIFPDIKVKVVDREFEIKDFMCSSVNDPHMTTFDGRKYEHHIPGEYILYRSTQFPIQVNAIYQYCNGHGGVTCNCGFAIKNADALFVANFCTSSYSKTSFQRNMYMERNFCDDTYMSIKKTGNIYTFSLPTGTEVSFERIGNRGISYIYIKPSELDLRATEGLCGFFSKGKTSDDLQKQDKTQASTIKEFTDDWAIPADKELRFLSLFDFDYKPSKDDNNYPVKEFCVCRVNSTRDFPVDSAKMTCRVSEAVSKCTNQRVPKEIMNFECTKYSERRKRDTWNTRRLLSTPVDSYSKPVIVKYPIEPLDVTKVEPYVEPDWRNGWTEEKAREECEKYILGSSITKKCTELLPTINSSKTVEDCILDIKLSGNTEYVEIAQRALTAQCVLEGSKTEVLTMKNNTNNDTTHNNTTDEEPQSLFETLLKDSCPKNCSGNGNCMNGGCICSPDFMGVDCSHKKLSSPTIIQSSEARTCDTYESRCSSVVMTGEMFSEDEIQCKITHFKVYEDGIVEYEPNAEILEGEPINDFSCVCPLTTTSRRKRSVQEKTMQAEGFVISISNGNGSANFSEENTVLTFNSACYECNTTSYECTEKSTCPKIGSSGNPETTDYTMTIAAAVSGVGGFLIIVFIFILFRKKCTRDKITYNPEKTSGIEKENSTLSYENNFDRPASANSIFITKT